LPIFVFFVCTACDTSAYPTKPQYAMADDKPLALVECTFPDILKWELSAAAEEGLRRCVTARWEALAIECAMTAAGVAGSGGLIPLRPGTTHPPQPAETYKPLSGRERETSFDVRKAAFETRQAAKADAAATDEPAQGGGGD
jgi:hypothetical protein